MDEFRRSFLKLVGNTAASRVVSLGATDPYSQRTIAAHEEEKTFFNVRTYGATGNGTTIDTKAINRTIAAAHAAGGGTVYFPAGTYASYSIHLQSNVVLYLEQGCTILAAKSPTEPATTGYYDPAESNEPWEKYQQFGHNHFHNSLIWGENLSNIGILGPGRIWGRGLSRGSRDQLPLAETSGVGNKAIALKSSHNVIIRDISILEGGHFAVLVTGVDNLTFDNLKIDTNRDGIDIVSCRNVRVANCSINSPWDDAICPKSQYILGDLRATENLTITNCFITGGYEMGTMLDGTWKRLPEDTPIPRTGRIKCGTESNAGFKNITISNCVFELSRGLALETVDGALLEDITVTGLTMRECTNTPIFMRLGARMRAPEGLSVGSLKRVIIDNVVSYRSNSNFGGGGLIAGIPEHQIQDIKISNVYLEHIGKGTPAMAAIIPDENVKIYPDPKNFGNLPASGFFLRHVKNIEFTNVELAWKESDARPAFWMHDVKGVDIFRLKLPRGSMGPGFQLHDVSDFTLSASRGFKDVTFDNVAERSW